MNNQTRISDNTYRFGVPPLTRSYPNPQQTYYEALPPWIQEDLANMTPTPPTAPPRKSNKKLWWTIVGLVAALIVGFITIAVLAPAPTTRSNGAGPSAKATHAPATPTAVPTPLAVADPVRTTKAGPQVVSIDGDNVVHVGEDVPPGVYRVESAVDPDSACYWLKSNDAEGSQIIDNGLPSGGRPQVILKKGQWFTTARCPNWVKK